MKDKLTPEEIKKLIATKEAMIKDKTIINK